MRPIELLVPMQAGLHCPLGAFYIDPVRPVARALVTHAHSDHARSGHEAVLATAETLDLMRLRYGEDFAGTTQAVGYGETVRLDGVSVTFHPAGHVLGSAQIAVVRGSIRIVVSGDYIDQYRAAESENVSLESLRRPMSPRTRSLRPYSS